MVESELLAALGQDKMQKIHENLPNYIAEGQKGSSSGPIFEALQVLSSLSDFVEFKGSMLAKKREMAGEGNIAFNEHIQVFDVPEVLDRIQNMNAEGTDLAGWDQLINETHTAAWMKKTEGAGTLMRTTIHVPLKPAEFIEMMTTRDPEFPTYMEMFQSNEVVHDWGPEDCVFRRKNNFPWAMRYVMAVPDFLYVRVVTKSNWPEEGMHSLALIPYDIEKNVCAEKMGILKLKCGSAVEDPEDEDGCIFTMLDSLDQGYVPDFALKMLWKNTMVSMLLKTAVKFKESAVYERFLQRQEEQK